MGRGRAKAKQTKVARELKYSAPGMDLSRLQRDLHSDDPLRASWADKSAPSDDTDDEYQSYEAYADDDDNEGSAVS